LCPEGNYKVFDEKKQQPHRRLLEGRLWIMESSFLPSRPYFVPPPPITAHFLLLRRG
jgi:hypothetical protein